MELQPNLTCNVCSETEFHLKEGYYYCNECGTKSEQVRAFVLEKYDEDHIPRNSKKINKPAPSDKPEFTSWECYNFMLKGMVDELIDLGAKEELKLMVLQIWAAFLRNREVAFFSRRHPELPKLGIHYEEKDASILYNHVRQRQKSKNKRRGNSSASGVRKFRKQMKNFDQSLYEASLLSQSQSLASQSFMSQSSFCDTSLNSSGTAASNRAIQLKFSSSARKLLKKKMPLSHLKKHEQDFDCSLKCHQTNIKASELTFRDRNKELNMKLVYAILAVALNLIEDEIQLTDLLRFISEGHISSFNLERFFPEKVSDMCKSTLRSYRLNHKNTEFAATQLREHCAQVCKAIHLNHLKTPDILKLVQRYTTEMCLPEEINTFIERLINLHSPTMEWSCPTSTPCFESRAMAYIILTLKLLFGLDGRKEKQISRSARRVNAELSTMNLPHYEELFVWDDWVEYIELRKVILCKNIAPMCKQFKQIPPRELYLQHLEERTIPDQERLTKSMAKEQANMGAVFQQFLNVEDNKDDDLATLNFSPSFTPCHNYLKRLKLDPQVSDSIPKVLYVDHSKRSLAPFVRPTKLKETFAKCGRNLSVVRLACTTKRSFVGIFRNPFLKYLSRNPLKVNLTEDSKPWDVKVEAEKPADSIFNPYFERYTKKFFSTIKRQVFHAPKEEPSSTIKEELNISNNLDKFEEDDMDPGKVHILHPRRNLESINIFADLSEDDDYEEMEHSQQEDLSRVSEAEAGGSKAKTKLKISNFDCWLLMGKAAELNETQANELKRSLQLTFVWLLETCALTIRVDWRELYDQLMVLETFFSHAIEPLENFKDRIIFQPVCEIKDINKIVRHFQSQW